MKKVLLSAAVALTAITASSTANAQEGFNFSVKGIPQMSWMLNSDDADDVTMDVKPAFGVAFGVGAGYNFNKNLGVAVDALYSMQGRNTESAGIEGGVRINYIKIPLMFTYNTGIDSSRKVAFIGKIGPQIGLRTSSKIVNGDGDVVIDDVNDVYSSTDFGAVAGAGVRFALAKHWTLDAGLRFDYSFTNAEDEDFVLYNNARANTNNMNLGLEVGLNYHIK